jgi:hypothetical protein
VGGGWVEKFWADLVVGLLKLKSWTDCLEWWDCWRSVIKRFRSVISWSVEIRTGGWSAWAIRSAIYKPIVSLELFSTCWAASN